MQNRPQGCIFFSPTKFQIPKVFKFEMGESVLTVPLPLLWFGTSPKYIHEVNENSYFSVEKTVCTTDYFSGWNSADGFLKGGADTCKGHSDISSSESRFFDKLQTSTQTMSELQFLGMKVNSIEMTLTLSQEKKEKIVKQCQDLLGKSSASTRELNQLTGHLASTAIAVLPVPLQYWAMQWQQILELQETGDYNSKITLSVE